MELASHTTAGEPTMDAFVSNPAALLVALQAIADGSQPTQTRDVRTQRRTQRPAQPPVPPTARLPSWAFLRPAH